MTNEEVLQAYKLITKALSICRIDSAEYVYLKETQKYFALGVADIVARETKRG